MKTGSRKAFTLVELLVVISVIAMLTGMLLPALARARQQGKSVLCLSNLRQMHLAATIYIEDSDGYFPISYYTVDVPESEESEACTISYNWDFTVRTNASGVRTTAGILWGGDTIEQVQQCPSFRGQSNTPHDPYTGYNYNTSFIGHGQYEDIPTPAKRSDVRNASGCVIFGDGQWSQGANKFMRSPLRTAADRTFSGRHAGTQGYRHNGRTNVVWCDGHAEGVRAIYTTVQPARYTDEIEEYNVANSREKIGFLSPDNSAYDLE